MCIYALKEKVNLYRTKNISVLMCFIDASKAIDGVNHRKLFMKLTQTGVPGYIVRVLIYWYAHQKIQIKFGGSNQPPLELSMALGREDSSQILFDLYINELSMQMRACNTGCMTGEMLVTPHVCR